MGCGCGKAKKKLVARRTRNQSKKPRIIRRTTKSINSQTISNKHICSICGSVLKKVSKPGIGDILQCSNKSCNFIKK